MGHELVWYQSVCDNIYLTHIYHVVCCVTVENLIKETGLWNNTFSRPDFDIFIMLHMIISVCPIF